MFGNYCKIVYRSFLRHVIYSTITICGLALGMAACSALFLYVQYELSYDKHFTDSNRIFRIAVSVRTQSGENTYASTPSSLAQVLKRDCPRLENAVRIRTNPDTQVRFGAEKIFHENRVFHTDPEIFQVPGIECINGNPATCLNGPGSVVITEETARKYFGDGNPLGKFLNFGYRDFEVTAVVETPPQNSHLHYDFLLSLKPFDNPNWKDSGWDDYLGQTGITYTYVKLQQGADIAEFEKEMNEIVSAYHPKNLNDRGITHNYFLQSLTDIHLYSHLLSELEPPGNPADISIYSAIALLILLIAAFNYINLSTARSASRAKETGVRKIAGAQRPQLIRQFIGESLLMSVISLFISILFLELFLPPFNTMLDTDIHFLSSINIYSTAFLVIVLLVTGVGAGSYTAFILSAMRPSQVLKSGFPAFPLSKNTPEVNPRGLSIRKVLIIFQFAASFILITGTIIIYSQLRFMETGSPGFDKDNLYVLELPTGALFGKSEAVKNEFTGRYAIHSAAATSTSTVPGLNKYLFKGGARLLDGRDEEFQMYNMMVDYDFIKTYGIGLSAGRSFMPERAADGRQACLINESAARAFGYPAPEDAIGGRIDNLGEKEIIGVVRNFHYRPLRHAIEPLLLTVNEDFFVYMTLKVEAENAAGTKRAIEETWEKLFPESPVDYFPLDEILGMQYGEENRTANIIFIFSALSIALAALGLSGLTSLSVKQRTGEIGIRKVLGASTASTVMVFAKNFAVPVMIAVFISIPAAWYIMGRWLQNYSFHIDLHPGYFLISMLITLVIAFGTVGLHTIKAARANCAEAMRYE